MNKVSVPISNDYCPQTLMLYGTYQEGGAPNFGLFCWFSYCWDGELKVMACIGGEKLTKDMIRQKGVFSANLVTESLLPLADYMGNVEGYRKDKMSVPVEVEKGEKLEVPILSGSPVSFELEVDKTIRLNDGDVFLCSIRNMLMDEKLVKGGDLEMLMRRIAPVCTTCNSYFGWDGKRLGSWGEPKQRLSCGKQDGTGF